jgi:fluoroquinolone transport system ATP-binding protein
MIEVSDLSFTYPGQKSPALHQLNFQLGAGTIFGFLGPSGSGKSTTQKVLYRWLRGYSGTVRVDGKSLEDWDRSYYEKIGVCFELPNHYLRMTALENLHFFGAFYPRRLKAEELLEQLGLGDAMHQRVSEFSKGMKMRLNIARALLHDPQILFLDEPTSGLDPVYAQVVKNLILEHARKGKTVFLTTHNMHDADELCDNVAFLSAGRIRALDTPASLKQMSGTPQVRICVRTGEERLEKLFDLNALAGNAEFLELLRAEEIISIHSMEGTLDDVFRKVTGEQLQIV